MKTRPARRMSRRIVVAVVLSVVGGCTGGAVATDTTPPGTTGPSAAASPTGPFASASETQTPSPAPTPTSTPERTAAGRITLIATQSAYVDEERAERDDPVFVGGSVRTDQNGSLKFTLDRKIASCTLVTNTSVRILPTDDILIHFAEGTAICSTRTDPGVVTLAAADSVELRMSDPEFLVTVEGDLTIVRVLTGLVEVASAGGSVLLGPKFRTDIVPGGPPGQPQSWGTGEIDDDDVLDAVNELRNLPGPDMSMPDVGGSPVLKRILEARTINVGRSDAAFEDSSVEIADRSNDEFVAAFFGSQSSDWKLGENTSIVLSDEAGVATVLAGNVDMFLSPGLIEGLARIPMFDDQQGRRIWIHYDPQDAVFGEAQRTYLRNYVIGEGYRINFLRSFGDEPTYDAVAELFGLD